MVISLCVCVEIFRLVSKICGFLQVDEVSLSFPQTSKTENAEVNLHIYNFFNKNFGPIF